MKVAADVQRPPSEVVESYQALLAHDGISCVICDCLGRVNAMNAGIQPTYKGTRLAGPAVTARTVGNDLAAVFAALDVCQAGDVLIVATGGTRDVAFWGENTTLAALHRGVAGLVTDGSCRDVSALERLRFPVFSSGVVPNGGFHSGRGQVNAVVPCGGVVVHPGDLVVADENGVVVVPHEAAGKVLADVQEALGQEAALQERLKAGASLSQLMRGSGAAQD